MKKIHLVVLAAACGLLTNCKSTVAMKSSELAGIMKDSPLRAEIYQVSVQIKSPGEKALTYPEFVVRPGVEFSLITTRDFVYPAAYDVAKTASGTAVIPPSPRDFKKAHTGVDIHMKVEPKGQMAILSGIVKYVDVDRMIRMGGEIGRPIVNDSGSLITENRIELPAIRTYETPVFYAVKRGGSGSFEIDHPTRGTRMIVTVTPMDATGRVLR